MIIKCDSSGPVDSNTYLVGASSGSEAVIIDAGASIDCIVRLVETFGMIPKLIIITHSHFDHIYNLNEIRDRFGIPAAIHRLDATSVTNTRQNGAFLFGRSKSIHAVEKTLEDGQVLRVGGIDYKIIHTPGHSPGGICILAEGALFTGDTLFRGSIGRTDLYACDHNALINSITEKLFTLDDDTSIYPGHDIPSTIGEEKRTNVFL